ncbi:MAG TPA: hypothetical protein VHL30_05140, partial [Chlamydiales bacterium]|nr:hypothetical protein [Chlamydiales bacterium]
MMDELPPLTYWNDAWFRFKANRAAFAMLWVLATLAFLALFGPLFSSYTYTEIHLELKNTPPGALYWFGSDELGRDL